MAKKYEWTVKIAVDPVWVADGFNLTEERLHEMVLSDLSYARHSEVKVKIIAAPDPARIAKEQGEK